VNDPVVGFIIANLVYVGPMTVLYLIVGVVALFQLGRARVPALLVIAACGMGVGVTIGAMVVRAVLVNQMQRNAQDMQTLFHVVSVCATLGHAVELGLFAAAAFVGRRPAAHDSDR
jgi:uncharacterized protein YhhL (DUF1145 family)